MGFKIPNDTGGNLRFLFMRVKIHSPKISKTLYYVSSASCQNINIRNNESFESRRQSESDKSL